MPVISSDAPGLANLTFGAVRAAGTMLAWLFSDVFERMPGVKIALSEGNIGWMPYFIERAEQVIDKQRHWAKHIGTAFYNNKVATEQVMADLDHIDVRGTIREHIFGCFIEESSGLRSLDIIGEDNVMIETDQSFLMKNGRKLPIMPGMVCDVEIVTGRKSILTYLLKPVLRAFDEALTER